MAIFYRIRACLGLFTAGVETYLFAAVTRRIGEGAGFYTLLFLAVSAGMFNAAAAFLPSTFAMCSLTFGFASWMHGFDALAVLGVAVAALIGWPFCALVGLPIAVRCFCRLAHLYIIDRYAALHVNSISR